MMKIKMVFMVMALGAAMLSGQGAEGVLQQVDGFRVPYDVFMARTRITTYVDTLPRESAVFEAYISGPEKSLVIQKSGKNRDMKILYREEMLWVALPGSRRPIRITPIQRLMGQASNGDVARLGWHSDYAIAATHRDTLEDRPCLRMQLKAKKPSSTYAAITLWVRASDFRPVKAHFFTVSGKRIKRAVYNRYDMQQGRPLLQQMTLYDELRKREKTVFVYESITPKSVPARYYNKNYLVHVHGL